MTNLNNFLAPNSGVNLTDAFSINDAGQILAVGNTIGDNWEKLYLLTPADEPLPVPPSPLITPTPEPSTLAIFAMASIGWAARRSIRRRAREPEPRLSASRTHRGEGVDRGGSLSTDALRLHRCHRFPHFETGNLWAEAGIYGAPGRSVPVGGRSPSGQEMGRPFVGAGSVRRALSDRWSLLNG